MKSRVLFSVAVSLFVSFVIHAQQWVTLKPMTGGTRYGHAAVTGPDGKVYVFGGQRGLQCLSSVERYDPLTNTSWVTMPSMSVARCQPGAAMGVDGKIYVVGGDVGNTSTASAERFDTKTMTWESLPPLNIARGRPVVAVGSDLRIYAIGGHSSPSSTQVSSIEVFDESTGWTLTGVSPVEADAGATGIDGDIYTFGVGSGGQWARFSGAMAMAQAPVTPQTNGDFTVAAGPDGLIYLLGVGTHSTLTGSAGAAAFNVIGLSTQIPGMNRSRGVAGAATAAEGRVLVSGGTTKGLPGDLNAAESYGPLKAAMPAGATAWYRFEEPNLAPVVDAFGANHGIPVGGPPHHSGRVGRTIRFPGGQHVRVPNAPGLNFGAGDMTIEGWMRWLPAGTNINLVSTILDKRTYNGGYQGYSLFLYKGRLGVQLANGSTYVNYGASIPIKQGEWTHIAVTLDRSANLLSVYVNSVLDRTWTPLAGSTTNPAPLFIGRHSFYPEYYRGMLDELTFYDRALRWAEVRSIFVAGREGKEE